MWGIDTLWHLHSVMWGFRWGFVAWNTLLLLQWLLSNLICKHALKCPQVVGAFVPTHIVGHLSGVTHISIPIPTCVLKGSGGCTESTVIEQLQLNYLKVGEYEVHTKGRVIIICGDYQNCIKIIIIIVFRNAPKWSTWRRWCFYKVKHWRSSPLVSYHFKFPSFFRDLFLTPQLHIHYNILIPARINF